MILLLISRLQLGLVYTSDGSGVGIGRKFWSSVNRHDGSGIVGLAFVCKHLRWRTREMTRNCCFCYCFLFSYHDGRRLQGNQGRRRLWVRGVFLKRKSQGEFGNLVRELLTNENITQMKLYSLLLYIPVWSPTCLATSSHASLFLLLSLKSL